MSTLSIHNPATGELITALPADDAASVAAKDAGGARRATGLGGAAAGRAQALHRGLPRRRGARPGAARQRDDARDRQADPHVAQRAERPAAAHRLLPGGDRARRSPTRPCSTKAACASRSSTSRWAWWPTSRPGTIPWFVGCNVILPALLTGNAVLYKPSEYATLTGQEIARLLHEAGVPRDVMACLVGGGEVGAALLAQPVDGVFFTGSHATGQRIAEAVARALRQAAAGAGRQGPDLRLRRRRPEARRPNRWPTAPCTTPARAAARSSASTCTRRSTTPSSTPSCRRCAASAWATR